MQNNEEMDDTSITLNRLLVGWALDWRCREHLQLAAQKERNFNIHPSCTHKQPLLFGSISAGLGTTEVSTDA